jgi:hypothetical protein
MRAMILNSVGPLDRDSTPLHLAELPLPEPGPHELRMRLAPRRNSRAGSYRG